MSQDRDSIPARGFGGQSARLQMRFTSGTIQLYIPSS